mmetsp:Transcript_4956/g.21234  ORF Transcript_4956/g.21234 Transcript_4956/m.21234 type:complete len:362 (+) Transcript_4956:742-1827(+)
MSGCVFARGGRGGKPAATCPTTRRCAVRSVLQSARHEVTETLRSRHRGRRQSDGQVGARDGRPEDPLHLPLRDRAEAVELGGAARVRQRGQRLAREVPDATQEAQHRGGLAVPRGHGSDLCAVHVAGRSGPQRPLHGRRGQSVDVPHRGLPRRHEGHGHCPVGRDHVAALDGLRGQCSDARGANVPGNHGRKQVGGRHRSDVRDACKQAGDAARRRVGGPGHLASTQNLGRRWNQRGVGVRQVEPLHLLVGRKPKAALHRDGVRGSSALGGQLARHAVGHGRQLGALGQPQVLALRCVQAGQQVQHPGEELALVRIVQPPRARDGGLSGRQAHVGDGRDGKYCAAGLCAAPEERARGGCHR